MQSELSAAQEEVARLRALLNQAEARFVKLADAELRKREREEREGVDMAEPDWNHPEYAMYQLEQLEKKRAEIEDRIEKNRQYLSKEAARLRSPATDPGFKDGIRQTTALVKKYQAKNEEDLETINRRIAQLKGRLGRINARLPPYEQMNNLYV